MVDSGQGLPADGENMVIPIILKRTAAYTDGRDTVPILKEYHLSDTLSL